MPPFRRLLLSPERVSEELKRVQDGVLVRLTVAEFDALVERAARSGKRKAVPRLLEARYHATLKEESLIGEGQWKLVHTGLEPGLLKLEPFNLALRQARFENDDALIAAFDGKIPSLLIKSPGERTVSLDWSARGESGPEGLQFHLEMPSCPVALLEVDVPVGRAVTVLDDGAVLSGPHQAETGDLRRWKIVCGGRQRALSHRVDFRVRRPDRTIAVADRPTPFVRQKTTQKLNPDGLEATFELTLDGLATGIRELVCECDAELHLRDVIGPGVDGCCFQAGDANNPSLLTIRLREPMRAGTWQILCLAPLNASPMAGNSRPIAWRSPGLRLVSSVPRGETLTLCLHPDLQVESWDPGSYRMDSSTLDRASGTQVLTLLGGGLSPSRRPAARLQSHGVEFSTQQLTWWRCDAAGLALTLQIGWDVRRGQLFQLPVHLPPNWTIEKVEMSPSVLLRDWRVGSAAGKATLFVNLASPLTARSDNVSEPPDETEPQPPSASRVRLPILTVQLRQSSIDLVSGKSLAFPDVEPQGARFRQGALALDCDQQLYHLDVQTTAERAEPESDGPWGLQLPEYYYRFRGQPITGIIRVLPRPPRLHARCDSEVFVGSGEAVLETHLMVEAEVGSPNTIEFSLSAGDDRPWQWRNEASSRGEEAIVNRVRSAERVHSSEISCLLHILGATDPLSAAVAQVTRPTGERWKLTLTRPLHAREQLHLRARRRLLSRDEQWDVPLPVVLGTVRMEGEVMLHLAGTNLVQVHPIGLREVASADDKGPTPWRTFRYAQSEVGLAFSGQAVASEGPNMASIEYAKLISYVGENSDSRHHFSFQVANWSEHTMPLRLPVGSLLWAVQVDGRWLPRLIPVAAAVHSQADSVSERMEVVELALPVPARGDGVPGRDVHRFEVVYTRTLPPWTLWQELDAAPPRLPVAPLAFRHTWRLHPKLTPLLQGHYRSLPGTAAKYELSALPRHASDFFHFPCSLERLDPLHVDQNAGAREALERTVQELRRRHPEQTMSLREVVSETAFDYLKDRYSLIIDFASLRDAGMGAEMLLTIQRPSSDETMPWHKCGLIAVPARSAIVLTTRSGQAAVLRESFCEDWENALVEAARQGQDSSGRFRSALNWLHSESSTDSTGTAGPRPLDYEYEGINWSEWESVSGLEEAQLIVVRRDVVTALGIGLGLVLCLAFWRLRQRSFNGRLTLLFVVFALFGSGVIWLPTALRDLVWWPLLASVGVAAIWYACVILRHGKPLSSSHFRLKNAVSTSAIAGILLLAILGWQGRAATPVPISIYIVPGTSAALEKQTVLVPVDLLDRLKALARPSPLAIGGPQTVLLDASYEGRIVDGGKQSDFAASFSAHCFTEESSTLMLPLSGVQLTGEVLLDGARAAPVAPPPPQSGYSLSIRGQGRHKIELRFRVPVLGTDEDRNVLFTPPPLVRSKLSWRIPAGANETQVLVKNGAQWTTRDDSGLLLEADLGSVPLPVHLHWNLPRHPARVQYQAAYLWDLGVEANHLTSWIRYHVEQGAIKTLEVELPAELEVSSANAQRTMSDSTLPWLTRFHISDWYVSRIGNRRTLHLEFPYPISGDFQVTLQLMPRTPLTSPVALSLPSPRGVTSGGSHYMAYRTKPGLTAQRSTSQHLTRIGNKEFAPDWLGGPRLEANFQGIAYRIAANQQPQLLLRLEKTPPVIQGLINITVRTGMQRAEIEATADVKCPNKDLAAIKWDLPPHCILATVTGENVGAWKQHGSSLLVWLNRTTTSTRIHLGGWLTLESRDGLRCLDLGGPRLAQAASQHTMVHLVASGEVDLTALRTQNLQQVSPGGQVGNTALRPSEQELSFETWASSYRLECRLQSAANAVAQVLTFAEVAEGELRFTTTVNYTVRHGELRYVRIRLRNWAEEKIDVQAERVALWPGPRWAMGERSWSLPLQPGVRGNYHVTLRGSLPLDKASGGVPMPEVLVQDVERADYFVAVAGRELTGQANGSLQFLTTPLEALQAFWPSAAQRMEQSGGQAWHIGGSEWQLRLLPFSRGLETTSVRVYLLERSSAVVNGDHWLHEARCWLRHEAHADLKVVFPLPAYVFAASVDGVEVTPIKAGSAGVWLPLPGRPGVHCIRMRWIYDRPEPLDRPNLTAPLLADAVKGPILGTVMVPSGWELVGNLPAGNLGVGATREAALALWRADAQLRIRQDLVKQRGDNEVLASLDAAQKGFELYCGYARHALDLDAHPGTLSGPQGRSLASWLEELQMKNRSLQLDIGDSKTKTSSSASAFCFPISVLESNGGTPVSWRAPPGAEPLKLQLTSRESEQTRQALTATGEWLGCLLVAWMFSFLPFFFVRLRLFWPEQIALLGMLGWHLAGLTSIVLGLLLFAACGRILILSRGFRALLLRHRQKRSNISAGSISAADGSPAI